jgi:hypothetical protein
MVNANESGGGEGGIGDLGLVDECIPLKPSPRRIFYAELWKCEGLDLDDLGCGWLYCRCRMVCMLMLELYLLGGE